MTNSLLIPTTTASFDSQPTYFQNIYKRDEDENISSTGEFFQDLQQLTTIKAVVSSSTRSIDNAVKSATSSLSSYDGLAAAGIIITDSETVNKDSILLYSTSFTSYASSSSKSISQTTTSDISIKSKTDGVSSSSTIAKISASSGAASRPQILRNSSTNGKLTVILYGLLCTALISIGL